MSCLRYCEQDLYIENMSLAEIAHKYGTPCYVYSRAAILNNLHSYQHAFDNFPHLLCYAVKANSNIAILKLLADAGSGFDIVSIGELKRVITAGGHTNRVIFSGVGKSSDEIQEAIRLGIFCFNIESEPELERIAAIAKMHHKTVNVMLRVNPDIDAKTHSYISTGLRENKFGMNLGDLIPLFNKIQSLKSVKLIGVGAHIGSQITELQPFMLALDHLLAIYTTLKEQGISLQYINIGGGLGINYRDELPPSISEYATALRKRLADYPVTLMMEPGRSIVGNAGVLLAKIEYLKDNGTRHFAITDTGMNDLVRPALYSAWQNIMPVRLHKAKKPLQTYDITGPVCESADFLGKNRDLALEAGEYLAIDSAGAYGFCMSSNYNSRNRAAEVLVDGDRTHLIRRRETIEDAMSLELLVQES